MVGRTGDASPLSPAVVTPLILRATLVARVESRRRHRGGGGGLFGAQPTPVWPSKQPSRVALHGTDRLSANYYKIKRTATYRTNVLSLPPPARVFVLIHTPLTGVC